MKEVYPTIICGSDGTPFTKKEDGVLSHYECSHGHIVKKIHPRTFQYCPLCMNNEYLLFSMLASNEDGHENWNFVFLCSNPACPRYRLSISPDNKTCSMFISRYNRLFMLDLTGETPNLIYKKRYSDNWLGICKDEIRQRNRKIRLLFFQMMAHHKIKIVNGTFVKR